MTQTRVRAPPGTWRLLGPASLGWAVVAATINLPGSARWVALGAGAIGVGACVWALRSDAGRTLLATIGVASAALLVLGVSVDAAEFRRDDPSLSGAAEARASAVCEGKLTSYPNVTESLTGPRWWIRGVCNTERGGVPVLLWLGEEPEESWAPALRVRAEGTVTRLEPSSNAAYGFSVSEVEVAPPASAREQLGAWSASLRVGLQERAARVPAAQLVPGFAVGDTSLVGDELDRVMLESSLTHLTAVSGANCALVTAAVVAVAARLGAGRRLKIVLAAVGLIGFVVLVGPDASVQRAAVMATVVLVSGFGGKRAVSLPALGAAMLVLLLSDPWQALQAGFGLSVAATAGILLLTPSLQAGLERVPYLPRWIALPVALAAAAQIACGPLLLLLRPGIPAAGVLANVIAAPAAPVGTGLGLLSLLLLPLGAVGEMIGTTALWLASLAARWVQATAEVASAVPFATLTWPGGWAGALLLTGVESAAILAWMLGTGRVAIGGLRRVPRSPWESQPQQPSGLRRAVALLVGASAGVFVAVVAATPLVERSGIPRDWVIVACDVGQGDAIVVRDPEDPNDVMLIDTGDDAAALARCLDRFRVSQIALLVLTHDDRDHVGALSVVAARTEAALVAPGTAEPALRPVVRNLETAGIPHIIGQAGLGGSSEGISWVTLAPSPGIIPADSNAASLVLRVNAGGVTLLALGDTGAEEHRALLEGGAELAADVVKVAHHGSNDQDPALLAETEAQIGLISVGIDNRYGHPGRESLEALSAAGTAVLRTDQHGSIAISKRGDQLHVWAER